ncbi:glucose dehydrogenase [FAD, quinone]-like [Ischnura elegans]|uniref:glucose dehydrogenase [FAD, quinone]-like n=1 Tax=Ischnura elegans TaxID=197161 RepID=UPI001ED8BA7B|nr:glucose dehydrogenase [FAD, quinone]-like [Ischnura elegans]
MTSACCGCNFVDTAGIIPGSCNAGFALFMSLVQTLIMSKCEIADPCRRLGRDGAQFPPLPEYDFVVVGAGVAGSVVAARLSEPRDDGGQPWSVLLLEAGPEEPSATQVPAYAVAAIGTDLDWKYTTERQEKACLSSGGICKWPRGKMVAGTGAMNGMMYNRGNRRIYDEWNVDGWSFDEVLPYFIKAENNKNPEYLDAGYHGFDGPLPVQSFRDHPLLSEDVVRAAVEMGYGNGDVNGANQTGFVIAQMMTEDGMRVSSAKAYLRPNYNRQNLRVAINVHVTRVVFDGIRAVGVEYVDASGAKNVVNARKEVVLSAGALSSPQLLLLSGVGPKEHLTEMGIPVVADIPGVGKNLHNHISTGVGFTISKPNYNTLNLKVLQQFLDSLNGPMSSTGLTQNTGYLTSKYQDEKDFPDLQVFFDGFGAGCSNTGQDMECKDGRLQGQCGRMNINARPTNVLPESRGYLRLRSADPFDYPVMQPNYFSVDKDVLVLVEGIKMMINLTRAQALKQYDFQLIEDKVKGCEGEDFGTDEYWICMVTRYTGPEHHQSGTVKMGNDDDPDAVLNPRLRVRGVQNVRVVDASIFPRAPNTNPVATIIMCAEKLSDMVKEDWEEVENYERIASYHPGGLVNILSKFYGEEEEDQSAFS